MLKEIREFYGRNEKVILVGVGSVVAGIGLGIIGNKFIKPKAPILELDFQDLDMGDIIDDAVDVVENLTE